MALDKGSYDSMMHALKESYDSHYPRKKKEEVEVGDEGHVAGNQCPACMVGVLFAKDGRYGRFLGCNRYSYGCNFAEGLPGNTHPNHVTKQKVESQKSMSTKVKKPTFTALKGALVHGAKVGAADEAGELLLQIGQRLLGDKFTSMTQTDTERALAKLVIASVLHAVSDSIPTMLAHNPGDEDRIAAVCELVMEAQGRDLLQPHLKDLRTLFTDLASLGGKQEA